MYLITAGLELYEICGAHQSVLGKERKGKKVQRFDVHIKSALSITRIKQKN